jgi:lipoyl(octanoyl) transferase
MPILFKDLQKTKYIDCLHAMQAHVKKSPFSNEIWMTEHYPVYTLGRAASTEHIIHQTNIPVVRTDRGGQVTYHGPGQIVAYTMIEVKKFGLQPLELVSLLENATISFLATLQIKALANPDRRGVYINEQKVASIGLKMYQGKSYHGIALNLDTDLKAFDDINPCGYNDLKMTNLNQHYPLPFQLAKQQWFEHMVVQLEKIQHEH